MKINLTPEQWAAFRRDVADDPERSALQRCCGNISRLRDDILAIAETAGEVSVDQFKSLVESWGRCLRGHGFDDVRYPVWKTLRSLIEQAGLHWPTNPSLAGPEKEEKG